jgi:acyl-coenzyme A synthetase/AMP-(fatty) acid ligase
MCVSAAEALSPTIFDRFADRFGLEIVDGIGSTEMLHIFCSNVPGAVVRGSTGRPVPGYELRIVDEDGRRARRRGGRAPRGARRQLRGVLLAPAREDEGVDAGRLVHHGRPLPPHHRRRLHLRGPRRTTC